MSRPYPHLDNLLGAWFHQDYDIDGETVDAIVGAYVRTARPADVEAIRRDIAAVLRDLGPDLESAFERRFDLDIDVLGFAPSVRAFLAAIDAALSGASAV